MSVYKSGWMGLNNILVPSIQPHSAELHWMGKISAPFSHNTHSSDMPWNRPPLANLGLWDYRGKLGLWDYTLFEIEITETSFKIGIMDLKSNQIGISHPCKSWLRDFTLFKTGIMGLCRFWNWDYGITGPPLWREFSRWQKKLHDPSPAYVKTT